MVDEEWVLMAHGDEPDAYDYLATSKVSELTVAQLEQTLENSFLNKTNIEFWKGPITMHRLLEVSRTYPWGLPIPEAGKVVATTIAAGETINFQPTGTEIWEVKLIRAIGVGGAAAATVAYTDGSADCDIYQALAIPTTGIVIDLNDRVSAPLLLTNSLWLKIVETGTTNGVIGIVAYQVVSK